MGQKKVERTIEYYSKLFEEKIDREVRDFMKNRKKKGAKKHEEGYRE